jgi:hypothetical protein
MKEISQFQDSGARRQYSEGEVAKAIENQTAKVPSDLFLWVAGGAIAASLTFRVLGKKDAANWVGEWAPTILILGVYNKMVKLLGHDRQSAAV